MISTTQELGDLTSGSDFLVELFRKWSGSAPNLKCVRLEGMIPVIIDENTWERVQERMSDNKRNARNKAKRIYLCQA